MFPVPCLAALLLAAPPVASPPCCPDGSAVIHAMHARYAGRWYRSVTFVQTTVTEPGPKIETWYEALQLPGRLRIDIAPVDSGNMILFRNDSLYRFAGGRSAAARPLVHPLMVLGFDVYSAPPESTIARLEGLGFDLSRVHETTWRGRPAYVVGAAPGDTTTSQFWIEKDRLLFVRMLGPAPGGGTRETLFEQYQPLGQGWIAAEVRFFRDGVLLTREEYADVRGDVTLPDSLFDPAVYRKPGWVR